MEETIQEKQQVLVEINPADYKILVVDDVLPNVMLLKVMLSNEGYNIVTASNGTQALEQTYREKPDLILLDVMMPDITGYEVAQRLRSNPETAEIPVMFLTALNQSEDIVMGFKMGGNDFISKPFNKEVLMVRVKYQLSLIAAKRVILQQNEELARTIQGRDKLYSVIAHDLRSPMSSVKMVLNMLTEAIPAQTIGEDMHNMLSMVNTQTEEVFALLDNLLKWTKSQVGRLNVVTQDFRINELVDSVIDVFRMVAEIKDIQIVSEELPALTVRADIDMFKTILRNFLSNAIKFSNPGSKIRVTVEKQEHHALIGVHDQGCGISEEDQKKLFHTATHFSKYGTANEEGSGLGLLLCQDFAQKNGGDVFLHSVIGEGSTFSFTLPLAEEENS